MLTRLLPAIVAVGVIVAGAVLWEICGRSPRLRRVRWIIAALTVYGAVTLIYAAVVSVTLRATLGGAVLPVVFGGALVGAFLILPLGWIASVLCAGFPRFRTGSAAPASIQAIALTTCMALLVTSIPYPRTARAAAAAMKPEERLRALEKGLREIEDADREAPRDRWDPAYVVDAVGRNPQQLFAWVRDNTFWIPYRGVLRGPVGVLMDRQGNSLDRAILLATLLERAGHSVRLAHGELTQRQALERLPDLAARRRVYLGGPDTAPPDAAPRLQTVANNPGLAVAPQSNAEDVEGVTAHFQPVADSLGVRFTVRQEESSARAKQLAAQVANQTSRLLAALDRPDPYKERGTRFAAAIGALRDHWWVQLQDAQGWMDLDLLREPGGQGPLIPASETTDLKQLPPELHHEIVIRVVTEQWSSGALQTHKVLEHTLRPADEIGRPIVLQFWPTAWISDDSAPTARHTAIEAASLDQWGAALSIGEKNVAAAFLVESGGADEPKGGAMGGLGAAVAGALAGKTKPQEMSAVWLEYEIRVPGEPPSQVRRTVFDLLGPDARANSATLPQPLDQSKKLTRSLALMMRTEIQPVVCEIPSQFVQHLVAQSFYANRKLLTAIVQDSGLPNSSAESAAAPSGNETLEQLLKGAAPPASPLVALAAARLQSDKSDHPAFIGRPNILTNHRFFAPTVGDQIDEMEAVDIVANDVSVDLAEREAFPIRLWQGVLDTTLEAHTGFGEANRNVAEVFAHTTGWRAVLSAQGAGIAELSLPPDVRRQIVHDLERGFMVIAPSAQIGREPFVGWWRVNPATGDALGIGSNGWGTSGTERSVVLRNIAVNAGRDFLQAYAVCMAFPLALNGIRVINERYFGAWHPSWTKEGPKSKDFLDIVDLSRGKKGWTGTEAGSCMLLSWITAGFFATLPLLEMLLDRSPVLTRLEVEEFAAAQHAKAPPADPLGETQPGPGAKTQPGAGPQPGQPQGSKTSPAAESGPPQKPPPQTADEARKELGEANEASKKALDQYRKALKEELAYANNDAGRGGYIPGFADPSLKWDPAVEAALAQKTDQAMADSAAAQYRLRKAHEAAEAFQEPLRRRR
jgi:hypothetical protein